MPRRSNLAAEQRAALVLAALRGSEPVEVLARRHGVSSNTLRKWRDEFLAGGKARLAGQDDHSALRDQVKGLQKDLNEREMIIGELTVANRFLKKRAEDFDGTS